MDLLSYQLFSVKKSKYIALYEKTSESRFELYRHFIILDNGSICELDQKLAFDMSDYPLENIESFIENARLPSILSRVVEEEKKSLPMHMLNEVKESVSGNESENKSEDDQENEPEHKFQDQPVDDSQDQSPKIPLDTLNNEHPSVLEFSQNHDNSLDDKTPLHNE